jgi:hypothetical protein
MRRRCLSTNQNLSKPADAPSKPSPNLISTERQPRGPDRGPFWAPDGRQSAPSGGPAYAKATHIPRRALARRQNTESPRGSRRDPSMTPGGNSPLTVLGCHAEASFHSVNIRGESFQVLQTNSAILCGVNTFTRARGRSGP